ncbi:hypothetical protein [Thiofilum flexile]|uniref:hypothetical protein n=1 Tax=Thiofilum flexile TaxID=125627 RepID=UPI00037C988E|nr:hypothetical protein [Thiofilum flexile]
MAIFLRWSYRPLVMIALIIVLLLSWWLISRVNFFINYYDSPIARIVDSNDYVDCIDNHRSHIKETVSYWINRDFFKEKSTFTKIEAHKKYSKKFFFYLVDSYMNDKIIISIYINTCKRDGYECCMNGNF